MPFISKKSASRASHALHATALSRRKLKLNRLVIATRLLQLRARFRGAPAAYTEGVTRAC
jgi:hypothetical protein